MDEANRAGIDNNNTYEENRNLGNNEDNRDTSNNNGNEDNWEASASNSQDTSGKDRISISSSPDASNVYETYASNN